MVVVGEKVQTQSSVQGDQKMRTAEFNKWVKEGGELPQDLTSKEKEHLEALGWEENRQWYEDGQLILDEEWFNGNKIR